MGLGELVSARSRGSGVVLGACSVATIATSRSLLTRRALAGSVLDVRAGEHGWSREQLFVPESLALAATREGNEHAYLLLVAWFVVLRRHGWQLAAPSHDVSRESLLVVGDALDERGVMLGIAGFASRTRHDCRFVVIKPFSRNWADCRGRLAGLRPRGYTRIGPALRHAITTLARCPVRRRALLVLSDGQPTDFDRYEGRHGVADVHRAVEEAQGRGMGCFALALTNVHRPALASMFGRDRYALLPHPSRLPEALGELLGELVEG